MKRITAFAVLVAHLPWGVPPIVAAETRTDASPVSSVRANNVGYLLVCSSRDGIEVRMDGVSIGRTPLDTLMVNVGEHKLVGVNPDRTSWLDRDWTQVVTVEPNALSKAEVVFNRYYSINSIPYGAQVLLHGEFVGTTPAVVSVADTSAAVDVVVTKEGFNSDSLRLGEWSDRFVRVELRRRALTAAPSSTAAFIRAERISRDRKWIYISAGVGVVSGLTALYLKNRADDAYDSYLATTDPAQMGRLYDRAKRYDSYTLASFGLFQASFLSTVYFLVKSVNP